MPFGGLSNSCRQWCRQDFVQRGGQKTRPKMKITPLDKITPNLFLYPPLNYSICYQTLNMFRKITAQSRCQTVQFYSELKKNKFLDMERGTCFSAPQLETPMALSAVTPMSKAIQYGHSDFPLPRCCNCVSILYRFPN